MDRQGQIHRSSAPASLNTHTLLLAARFHLDGRSAVWKARFAEDGTPQAMQTSQEEPVERQFVRPQATAHLKLYPPATGESETIVSPTGKSSITLACMSRHCQSFA
jgi:hypothetical protein